MDIPTAIALTVDDASQVGEARRVAAALAIRTGLSETDRGNLAIVVTEAANNLVRHAGSGVIVLQPISLSNDTRAFDVLALDRGPGMPDVSTSLRDGYSTIGTPGEGLGAISRLTDTFDIFSAPELGTVLFARIGKTPPPTPHFDLGVVSLPHPREEVCGDSWAAELGGVPEATGIARFIVADGLGHGPGAAEASNEAIRVFQQTRGAGYGPARVLEIAHAALRSTRGAAAAIASIEGAIITFAGIGNIHAVLLTPDNTRNLASYNGTVGHQAHKFGEFRYEDAAKAILIMASDGLATQWKLEKYPGILYRHPAVIAGVLYRDFNRDRDDATVIVASPRDSWIRHEAR